MILVLYQGQVACLYHISVLTAPCCRHGHPDHGCALCMLCILTGRVGHYKTLVTVCSAVVRSLLPAAHLCSALCMDRIDVVARVLHQVLDINSGQQCLMAIWPGRVLLARLEKLHCPNSLD